MDKQIDANGQPDITPNAEPNIKLSKFGKVRFSVSFFIFALLWMGGLERVWIL